MTWIERIGEPLCPTRNEAEMYMTIELQRSAPPGWVVRRVQAPWLAWSISKEQPGPGEWHIQEYDVRLSANLDLIVFTHDNKDIGPLDLYQVFQNAMVIDASALREFGVRACLEHVMSPYESRCQGHTSPSQAREALFWSTTSSHCSLEHTRRSCDIVWNVACTFHPGFELRKK